MLGAIQRYVYERRRGLILSSALSYASYVLNSYISGKLEEIEDKMDRNHLAREILLRRFQSTHNDVFSRVMTLVPSFTSQILEEMDTEALTNELRSISRASRSRALPPDVFARLSDSITSASSSLSQNEISMEDSIPSTNSRTRGQLWSELKILTLTRTLTTLYTITLLSLFTAVQLNLLGRGRYIDSIRASDRAERERDQPPRSFAREAIAKIVDAETIWRVWPIGETEDDGEDDEKLDAISEATELRFLSLSWWVLHVGWRDVAARVRGSVESVFDDVSLNTKLYSAELFTLIMDVRRRVEMDSTGCKLSARFLSSLLPPTPETTAHVLAQSSAFWRSRGSEVPDSDCRSLARRPSPSSGPSHSTRDDIERAVPPLETPYDGLDRTNAIPIESPIPHHRAFPISPSSHTYESDLSSRASPSPASFFVPNPQHAASEGTSNSLATSRSSLDIDPQFTALLAQSRYYLSGPDFAHALRCALDRATEVLMDGLRARVFTDTTSTADAPNEAQARSGIEDLDGNIGSEKKVEVKIRLAGLLPGLSRWCQLALKTMPNELIDNIMAVKEVNALEAIIISDYEDRFPPIS